MSIELVFGGQLFLGSIFVFIVLKIYGKKETVLISSLLFLIKIILFGFSFEIILLFLEVIFITWRLKNNKENLMIHGLFYWVLVVVPLTLIWGLITKIEFEMSMTYFITVMQLNGLLNIAIADSMTNFTSFLYKALEQERKHLPGLRVLLFDMMVVSLVIPLLLYLLLTSINVSNLVENDIKERIIDKEETIQIEVNNWSIETQRLFKLNDQVLLSSLAAQFKEEEAKNWNIIVMDDEGNRLINGEIPFRQVGVLKKVDKEFYQFYEVQNITFLKKYYEWKSSWYIYSTTLLDNKLIIMTPLENYSSTAMNAFFEYVPFIIIVIFPLLLLVYLFTKLYLKTHFKLIEVTNDLPEKIDKNIEVEWPESNTSEISLFTNHFKEVSLRLREMYDKSKELNKQLTIKSIELEESKEEMKVMAYTDGLTGLPNRLRFNQVLKSWINDTDSELIGIIFLDLDRFKLINDTLGHDVGDKLLKEAAKRIHSVFSLKESQVVCRVGGDEFVVLIKGESKESIKALVNKCLVELNKEYNLSGEQIHSVGSIGVSLYPQDGLILEDIVKNADTAMYYSKRKGGNVSCFYSDITSRNLEEGDLDEA